MMERNSWTMVVLLGLALVIASCGGGGGSSSGSGLPTNSLPIYGSTDTGDDLASKFPDIVIPEAEAYVDYGTAGDDLITRWQRNLYDPLPPSNGPARVFQNTSLTVWADQIVARVNQERAQAGLGQLILDPHLERLAQAHARDMALRSYFSHTTPDGLDTWDRFNSLNPPLYISAGENSARGVDSVTEAMTGWMNSEKHRNNILKPAFTHIGVGVYFDPKNTLKPIHLIQFFAEFYEDPAAYEGWYEPGDAAATQ